MLDIQELSPTPGGTIPPSLIVGRKQEIVTLFSILKTQSVLIEEVRRMGKTLLLQKMEATPHKDFKVIYTIVQGRTDAQEFVEELLQDLRKEQHYAWLRIGFDRVVKLYNKIANTEIGIDGVNIKLPVFKNHWNNALEACIEDLANRDTDSMLVIVLDEFPVMIWDWITTGKVEDAKKLLDILRSLRQQYEAKGKLRFIFCGSIGMKVVLRNLGLNHSYVGNPFNDTRPYILEPMTRNDALHLCESLYKSGFSHVGNDKQLLFSYILQICENLPYFIHHIFEKIHFQQNKVISKAHIDDAVAFLLDDAKNCGAFRHYYDRLNIYYGNAAVMIEMLHFLSKSKYWVTEDDIYNSMGGQHSFENIKTAAGNLYEDHYLKRQFSNGVRSYQFKYQIIKRWWRLNKA